MGKTILLMRHSIPEKCALPTEYIPLSEEGKKLAKSRKELFSKVDKFYTSPYKRALETAKILSDEPIIVKEELHERLIGDATEDFWLKQYQDYDFCNPGGESLNMVSMRMKSAMDAIIKELADGETALVVSHATAICAFFLNYCEVAVLEAANKSRRIRYHNQEVLHGKINPTDYFELEYVNNEISKITFRRSR
ncbi:MAG: histidine phosphatase family protein [Lachnospiraceae bacterium]|jgi:2,3-bisphosphoglycerate-dependent phosphoglycerate mutase|nr:histidine phosphatase family protein [Lachnospiraceae bacterium]